VLQHVIDSISDGIELLAVPWLRGAKDKGGGTSLLFLKQHGAAWATPSNPAVPEKRPIRWQVNWGYLVG